MLIKEVIDHLEAQAPPAYQESYDNAGLITGSPQWSCNGIIVCLDATEEVIQEAANSNCNLVIAHHPIIFKGLKKLNGGNYIERCIIAAIKLDIAIYAIHTNLDNMLHGVNGRMAARLHLVNCQILVPRENCLMKLYSFVPHSHTEKVREAVFAAGGGKIGNYHDCSYTIEGEGMFTPGNSSQPTVGEIGKRETTREQKIEIIFPAYLKNRIVQALVEAHPYEEVAYDLVMLGNQLSEVGSGLIGELPQPLTETSLLELVKRQFNLKMIRHTAFTGRPLKKVALCGGAGSFLISSAIAAGADVFISSDIKYHEFFDADGRLLLADIGHYESEQFTIDLLAEILQEKFPTFAVLKTGVITNPVNYFL